MTIKLKATHSQEVTVSVTKLELLHQAKQNLDEKDIYSLTKHKLYQKINLPQEAFIKDGKWFVEGELYSSHSFTTNKYLRNVEESDKVVLKVLDDLKEVLDFE
jgi:hypothetical protein